MQFETLIKKISELVDLKVSDLFYAKKKFSLQIDL